MKHKILLTLVGAAFLTGGVFLTQPVAARQPELRGLKSYNNVLNPFLPDASGGITSVNTQNMPLFEDFESWDGADSSWLPQGWSIDSKTLSSGDKGWRIYAPVSMYDEITSKCMVLDAYNNPIDQWLVTPEVEVLDGMQLSFKSYPSPLYFFDWDYVDWNTFTFTELHVINDFKINISADGGATWTTLKALADDYKDINGYFDLYRQAGLRKYDINLDDYAGKKVMVAFQTVGEKDGPTSLVDEVSIGYPPLEVSYSLPGVPLFYGLTSTDEYFPVSVTVVPVYSPVTFEIDAPSSFADYFWSFEDTDGPGSSTSKLGLTVTYRPDYSSEMTTRNNIYDLPVLKASADRYADTEFTYPYWLQAGGKAEYERYYTDTNEREVMQLGMSVIDPVTEGTATYADIALPYFGYNQESDRYWTNRMFNGDSDMVMDNENYCKLVKHGNLFFSTDAPLVISGVRANGYGQISRNAQFKAEIFLVDYDFVIPDMPYAEAICTGDDITMIERYSSNMILSFDFKFDEPVVISTDLTPYYFVAISGFNEPKNVEYYSPEMSATDNPQGFALGWIGKDTTYLGINMPTSWSPVFDYTEELVSFYIMLDAAYPWLETDVTEVEIAPFGSKEILLDSYYDGAELNVTNLPSWLSAEVTGRYGDTTLTLKALADNDLEADITVEGYGVSRSFRVKNTGLAGVEEIAGEISGEEEIFTLSGLKVFGNLQPGIYIRRHPDGSVAKILVR